MDLIKLTTENLNNEHICCAISDKKSANGVVLKKKWLSEQLANGLVFKKLNVKGKVFIEYLPAENAWVPIDAKGYTLINCLWVSGSFKGQGYGRKLLEECLNDSQFKNGVAVISSDKKRPFLADKKFFQKFGFEVCDTSSPYFELLVKKINQDASSPKFKDNAKECKTSEPGWVLYYTDQCPFTDYYIQTELAEIEVEYHISIKKIKFRTSEEAQQGPSAFTTYSLFHNGQFLTHEILSKSRFAKIWADIYH